MSDKQSLHVVVAVVFNAQGQVLIAQRPEHLHKGGYWEFPGGKVERGESVERALVRELQEEVGVTVEAARLLMTIPHEYPEKHVYLDVWKVTEFSGDVSSCEGQPLLWVNLNQLNNYTFPEANRSIINALLLPPLYMITGKPAEQTAVFLNKLEKALLRGIRLVQLRVKNMAEAEFIALAERAVILCHQYDAKLLLNGSADLLACVTDADGIQLSSDRGAAYTERPVPIDKLLGVSCHSPEQLHQAEAIGADFALLSPVQATSTHPGDEPLGWDRFECWIENVSIPVYALGGMDASLAETAQQRGGQGIAAISALWEG